MTGGRIQPNSNASAAVRYLSALDRWVPNVEIAAHLGVARSTVGGHLASAMRRGEVEKRGAGRGAIVEWRIAKPVQARVFSIPNWPPGFVSQMEGRP